MNTDNAIAVLRRVIPELDDAVVSLEDADSEFQLRESHTGLQDAAEALRADLSRLESGTFD